ncbi:hypothetical protein CEXT_578121 [Caerostris extrusa]|uniref:Uncharacterized protein n=1 Tax=Caerostris extrusa TaxID=172846 RepID=A0AAV4Y959_CAEEX|nr:hypothetical protein CEXT_578121 [Caerostris extrusa]
MFGYTTVLGHNHWHPGYTSSTITGVPVTRRTKSLVSRYKSCTITGVLVTIGRGLTVGFSHWCSSYMPDIIIDVSYMSCIKTGFWLKSQAQTLVFRIDIEHNHQCLYYILCTMVSDT